MDEGAARLLAFFQEIKRELSFFLELLGGLNKRVRKVDSDNLRNFAGEFEGASTDCTAKIEGSKGVALYVGE